MSDSEAAPISSDIPQVGELQPPIAPDTKKRAESERRFIEYCLIFTLILAALSGIVGFLMSRADIHFVGAVYNIDDNTVYFSWTRQAADGHFFIRNLFTTDPQNPIQFNLLMLALGGIVRLTHIPIPMLFLIVRIVAGGFLLSLIYRLYRLLAPENAAVRCYAFFFACLGSGFGWLYWPRWADKNGGSLPVDTWQPEALTFQSIEMSALFAVSLILIVGTILLLALAQRSGQMRFAVGAGLCALILGNVHSYDILHVVGAWFVYLVVTGIVERRFDGKSWLQALVCGLIALPSPLYQLHMYNVDPVFHQRAHDLTLSLPPQYYALGYGVMFLLAAGIALYWVVNRFAGVQEYLADRRAALLPICWFCAALALSYTPHVDFQRKMIMGAHVPLCLMAGCGLAALTARMRANVRTLAVALCALLALPTTFLFVYRDLRHLAQDRSETSLTPFMTGDEVAALQWMRSNSAENAAFLGFPNLMCFVPGWCDRYTYVSHWGETPKYSQKFAGFNVFVQRGLPEELRAQYLEQTNADYFVFPNNLNGKAETYPDGRTVNYEDFSKFPDLLKPVYANKELTIYQILLLHTIK